MEQTENGHVLNTVPLILGKLGRGKGRRERSTVDGAGENRQGFTIAGSIPANTDAVLALPEKRAARFMRPTDTIPVRP